MINPTQRPFTWDEEESSNQMEGYKLIVDTADSYNISVLTISGECFASHCQDNELLPITFTVQQFNTWMDRVTDRLKELQIQIETEEFNRLIK
jgi:hypothetical protein